LAHSPSGSTRPAWPVPLLLSRSFTHTSTTHPFSVQEAQLSLSGKLSAVHLSLKAWTFHGLCNKFWRTYAPVKPKHDMHKSRNILQKLYPASADGPSKKVAAKVEPLVKHVCDVVKLIKNDPLGCPGNEDVTVKTVMELQVSVCRASPIVLSVQQLPKSRPNCRSLRVPPTRFLASGASWRRWWFWPQYALHLTCGTPHVRPPPNPCSCLADAVRQAEGPQRHLQ